MGRHKLSVHKGNASAPPLAAVAVDLSSCEPDLLGFCYERLPLLQGARLEGPGRFYFLSSEEAGGATVAMGRWWWWWWWRARILLLRVGGC